MFIINEFIYSHAQVFTSKSYPISTILNRGSKNEYHSKSKKKTSVSSVAKTSVKSGIPVESETSADENTELNHVDKLKVSKKKIHRSSSQFTLHMGRIPISYLCFSYSVHVQIESQNLRQ